MMYSSDTNNSFDELLTKLKQSKQEAEQAMTRLANAERKSIPTVENFVKSVQKSLSATAEMIFKIDEKVPRIRLTIPVEAKDCAYSVDISSDYALAQITFNLENGDKYSFLFNEGGNVYSAAFNGYSSRVHFVTGCECEECSLGALPGAHQFYKNVVTDFEKRAESLISEAVFLKTCEYDEIAKSAAEKEANWETSLDSEEGERQI